ncbi:TlpA family protein disulfide reductase [Oceanobacillus bengalensis]|uniref:TlpA family protein disulfide reductase n=1 Tax=Oceanobacillus bengalensis TaxID=1435466 RepID=UPI001FE4ED2E|nr:redoxin domain-containing protein [Oceanobacillus bengalensis]
MKKRIFTVLFGLILSIFALEQASAEGKVGLEIGNQAPDFELETLDGEKVKLSDFRGKPVMLNFWATWCPPCREEMPDMQKFHENNDVVVLAINVTHTEINEKNAAKFVDEFGFTFDVLLDVNGEASDIYRIRPIPTTYMITSKGEISHKALGALTYEAMVEELEKME